MNRYLKSLAGKCGREISRVYLSFGSTKKCPICEWTGHSFLIRRIPHKPAPTNICPNCGSSERHRFAFLVLRDHLAIKAERVLHFAPEKCIEPWLRSISKDYLSVDLYAPNVMTHMEITNLPLDGNDFTLIWCSHVLEHIEEDNKAICELYRVLRKEGRAIIMVPIYGDTTYENPEVETPQERLLHFKQKDHVRLYGLDVVTRLNNVGFRVKVITTSMLSPDEVSIHELEYPSTKEIFLCTKVV